MIPSIFQNALRNRAALRRQDTVENISSNSFDPYVNSHAVFYEKVWLFLLTNSTVHGLRTVRFVSEKYKFGYNSMDKPEQ